MQGTCKVIEYINRRGVNTYQFYTAVRLSSGYQFIDSAMSDNHSVGEKLDLLLKSVSVLSSKQDALANRHEASQRELSSKLKKLEEDVTTAQEDATERALKRSKRDRSYEFKQKGHKEQFDLTKEWRTELMRQQRGSRGWLHLRGIGKPYRSPLMNYKKVWTLLPKGRSISI